MSGQIVAALASGQLRTDVRRFADVLTMGASGIHCDFGTYAGVCHHFAKNSFGSGGPADVAHADKKDFDHIFRE